MSQVTLAAPMSGWLMSVREVPDPVFSEEMMGIGIAIDPTEGVLVAPCAAEVLLVSPASHSLTLRTATGAEILIHIGLETVALDGRGFDVRVGEGDRVTTGDELIRFDLDQVGLEARSLVTPIILTNPGEFSFIPKQLGVLVKAGQPVATIRGEASSHGPASGGEVHSSEAEIGFEHGLHARPAARIADCAKGFSSEVTISAGAKSAGARRPVAMMALNARKGDRVLVSATGEDAARAVDAIVDLLRSGEELRSAAPVHRDDHPTARAENEIAGVCALAGMALGTAIHWHRKIAQAPDKGRGADVEREALEHAVSKVRTRLQLVAMETSGPSAEIALAHIAVLEDEELNGTALEEIEGGRSAGRAWQLAIEKAAEGLRNAQSARVRERIADLEDISAQVVSVLAGDSAPVDLPLGSHLILIADDLLPSEILSLRSGRVAGIATAGGGATSHMAIIAASFGIPTLVAMGPDVLKVEEGTSVLLDATAGVLVTNPDEEAIARARAFEEASGRDTGECRTRDGVRVHLLANLGGVEDVQSALNSGAEGCGLLRTEFLFLDRADAPSVTEQQQVYQAIADALEGRPVTIRTLDIGGDKPVAYIRFPDEQNPALGLRGIRTEAFAPELIERQLHAIADVEGEGIKVMIPMVSSVAELRSIRERMNRLRDHVVLGIMVETPAAALIADRLAKDADFLSIGSNDLAQYTLAMDRTNPLLAASIDALHPAVLQLMALTADAGEQAGKPVSVCGGIASDPLGALVLLGFGIRELSCVPAALPAVRHAISKVTLSDCAALAKSCLLVESAAEVRALAAGLLNTSDGE